MSEVVLDASAILALLHEEPGHVKVAEMVAEAVVGPVNLAEVVSKLSDNGGSEGPIRQLLAKLGLTVVPFDEEQAYKAGLLRQTTRSQSLSLGDRACLALAHSLGLPAITADRPGLISMLELR